MSIRTITIFTWGSLLNRLTERGTTPLPQPRELPSDHRATGISIRICENSHLSLKVDKKTILYIGGV